VAIDPDRLQAIAIPEARQRYGWRDCATYALGLGLGDDPTDPHQLAYVYERGLRPFPTMANILAYPGFWLRDLDTGVDWVKVVHAEQVMTLHRPLPAEGEVVGRSRVVHITDKGPAKGALIYVERAIADAADGAPIATVLQTVFCRGDGGFGGDSQSYRVPHPLPERAPDESVAIATAPSLALIYRLSGDLNPLHADPAVAAKAGFPRPILHGLATYGIAARALVGSLCGHRSEGLRGMEARFSAPLFPGETVTVDIWREGPETAAFRARVAARDAVVLTNGRATWTS